MFVLPGVIALRAIADAEANVGVHEQGGNNSGHYVKTYLASVGLPEGNPWCMAFWVYRHKEAVRELGRPLPADYPITGSTSVFVQWAMQQGFWIPLSKAKSDASVPQRGDLAFFPLCNDTNPSRMRHVGGVCRVLPTGVETVEGNTSPSEGVNADGDGVYRKSRAWKQFSCGTAKEGGFVRLPF